ncbi:hypothetical protein P3T76_001156 [Phytophthora citrophthora]|uniref:C2 NT-type domain-containing protein n=1 Tax=Phytophthora citrophthora TaxID=4793 RepID=A0AAD9H088_9STRA|nr:hypothetical protein P3T76_001156 [Phytophthora citrophthora]
MVYFCLIMSAVTWRSSWSTDASDSVDVQLHPEASGGVASLSSLPLQLTRPSDSSVPCELSLCWSPQPLRCLQLQIEVECSARHVELHAEGLRRNLLGEEEQGEVYLGTFRGVKKANGALPGSSEPQTFTMSPAFKQSDQDCNILKSLQTLKIKFVSLTGNKSVLQLQELRCVFVPMELVPTVNTSAEMAAKMAGVQLGGASDVQMMLKGFQQTLEREMETKIAQAVDAKLSTLSQRLAFSEQALFQLHKKMDAKDARVQASLNDIQQKFSQLDHQLNQFNVVNEMEKVETEEMDSKQEEQVTDADSDDEERKEMESKQVEQVTDADSDDEERKEM